MKVAATHKLADVAKILSGYAFDSGCFAGSGDLPIVRIRDVVRGYSNTFYTGDFSETFVVKNGDLLIGMDGEFNTALWRGGRAVLNQRVCKVIPDESVIDKAYLYYLLPKKLKAIEDATSFVTVKHLSVKSLQAIEITLPPLPEQKRIAAILDKADAIRRKRQQAVKLTEELLRSVFLDMFGDPVTNPKGWPQAPIKEFGAVMTGNTPSREKPEYYGEKIEWIKSDNINTPYHYLTEARERLSEEGQKVGRIVPAGSILVTCIAGSPECIGNVALSNREVAFNQQINAISPFEPVDSFFLYSQILVAKKLIQGESTESMKGMVSKGKFENILLIKPTIELQKQFGGIFRKLEALSDKNDKACNNSDSLFTSLLQRAFRGEL